MKQVLLASTVLLLSVPGPAQIYTYSPSATLASREGSGSCTSFGSRQSSRTQFLDGNLRGSAMTIKEVAFRPEGMGARYLPSGGMGRSWSSVVVRMAETDHLNYSRTFSQNFLTTPTIVFQSTVTWPTLSEYVVNLPEPFSIRFPFRTNYSYSGQRDACVDFTFHGGTLANNATWSSVDPKRYDMDSYSYGNSTGWPSHPLRVGSGCKDSGSTTKGFGWCNSQTTANATHPIRHFIDCAGFLLGANTPAVMLLGTGIAFAGIPFPGVTCDRLFVDPSKPMVLHAGTTNGAGNVSFSPMALIIPHQPAYLGQEFVFQVGWNDTKTRQLKLSSGSRAGIPHLPLFRSSTEARRMGLFGYPATSTTASFYNTTSWLNPIIRYTR